jgi:hypothetical protein
MGAFVHDQLVPVIQTALNLRFGPGDPLAEMVALQKEFGVFSSKHSLASAAALLNLAPQDEKQRRGWFRFLKKLKKVTSNQANVNGHDRIVSALATNLTAKKPMPVFFTYHPSSVDPGVKVDTGAPLSFSVVEYMIISAPTIPARRAASTKRGR